MTRGVRDAGNPQRGRGEPGAVEEGPPAPAEVGLESVGAEIDHLRRDAESQPQMPLAGGAEVAAGVVETRA